MRLLISGLIAMLVGIGPVALSSESTPDPDTTSEAEIVIFVLDSFTRANGDSCKPDFEATAIIRIEDSQENAWTIRFSRAEIVDKGNDFVPGQSGCMISRTIEFDPAESYSIDLNNQLLLEVEGSYFESYGALTLVIDEHGAAIEEQAGLTIPTPMPTPEPTSTPAPTPTPQPAGEQGDGTYLLRGYLTLNDSDALKTSDVCFGTGGYSDIGTGTQVVVRDGNNNVLGVGDLEFSQEMTFGSGCTFIFEIEVEEERFYQISMSHRGEMIFTFEELQENRWTVFLSLGR